MFKKQFFAIYAEGGRKKIINLLSLLELDNYCGENEEYFYIENIIDYERVQSILDGLRYKSLKFLSKLKERRIGDEQG